MFRLPIVRVVSTAVVMACQARFCSSHRHNTIYTSQIDLDMTWTAPTPLAGGVLPPTEIYSFERIISSYFHDQLKTEEKSGVVSGENILVTSSHVKDQHIDTETGFFDSEQTIVLLETALQFTYISDEPIGALHSTLMEVFLEDERKEELLSMLQDAAVIDLDTKLSSLSMNFSPSDDFQNNEVVFELKSDDDTSHSGASKGLIVACTLLSLALVTVSLILIWTVRENEDKKFCSSRVSSGKGVGITSLKIPVRKHNAKDEDDENVTNASGIIGANPNYDTENVPPGRGDTVKMTPHRGVYNEAECDMMSPLSQISGSTNFTDAEVSRPPLGIRSIKKLARCMTPGQEKRPYEMSKLSYT